MRHRTVYTPTRYILAVAALLACQACAPGAPNPNRAPEVYSQSGIVKIPPYTRSIINTNNF